MQSLLPILQKTLLQSRVFLLLSAHWVSTHADAQSFTTQPIDGERLDYTVTYEWGPFYLEVADVSFTTAAMGYSGTKLWSFEGWGATRNHWKWFYNVNSIYASVSDGGLNPINFKRHGREGSHRYDRWYFLKNRPEIFWISSDSELVSGSVDAVLDSSIYDVMTAVHHCRHLPWEQYNPGDTVALNLILDGEIHATRLDFKGTIQHEDPTTNYEVTCWEFSPTLIGGTVFKAGDQMRVIVTADDRRLPVFVETELVVGSARIYLSEVTLLDPKALSEFRQNTASRRDAALGRKQNPRSH
ncbi:MAG TPA: hypothetical protein DD635_05775 [Flavobacteriales bacterium]|nr:hypothetical protein [Flavobacteriales bacterium]|tara:strand:+ start:4156 stop:5052 length:897 start_codon:yes stop_codon:yes gene_type:complete